MAVRVFAVGAPAIKRVERAGTRAVAQLLFAFTALVIVAQLVFALTSTSGLAISRCSAVFLIRDCSWPL